MSSEKVKNLYEVGFGFGMPVISFKVYVMAGDVLEASTMAEGVMIDSLKDEKRAYAIEALSVKLLAHGVDHSSANDTIKERAEIFIY